MEMGTFATVTAKTSPFHLWKNSCFVPDKHKNGKQKPGDKVEIQL